MPKLYDRLTTKKEKDIRVLADFSGVYCRENHRSEEKNPFYIDEQRLEALNEKQIGLCADCTRLLAHGIAKLLQCPHDPKPMCKKCTVHCYAPGYREKMKDVMRFSGLYLMKHGRLDLIAHYYL